MYTYNLTLIRVKDGDTIEGVIDLGFRLSYKTSIRLAETFAPELKTPDGPRSKERLEQLLVGPLTVRTVLNREFEKYGRVLGYVTANTTVDVNKTLVLEGYATKEPVK